MQVSERVVLRYRDGPEMVIPPALLFEENGVKWFKLQKSHYSVAKLILGHRPDFKEFKNPSLSNCPQFAALQSMQKKALGLDKAEAGELFAEEEGDSEAKNTKKPKHLSKLPKECTIDVKGIAVVLKTPQDFSEDICVQSEASQLDAVCQFILDDLGDCFGKKRTYQQTGKHAKAAKQELAKND